MIISQGYIGEFVGRFYSRCTVPEQQKKSEEAWKPLETAEKKEKRS
jgi:hypothetical protein